MNGLYWREQLNPVLKRSYDSIYNGVSRGTLSCPIDKLKMNDVGKIFSAFIQDNPQFFWIGSTYQVRSSSFGKSSIEFSPLYNGRDISACNAEIERIAQSVKGKNELETELKICEYMVRNVTYEINNKYNQNACSSLYQKRAQCSGISAGVKVLCDLLNVWCIITTGDSYDANTGTTGPHAWNIVKIDGKYYHLDATNLIGYNKGNNGKINYVFFNETDEQIAKTHIWDRNTTPPCVTKFVSSSNSAGEDFSKPEYKTLAEMRQGIVNAVDKGKDTFSFILKVGDNPNERQKLAMSGAKMALSLRANVVCSYEVQTMGDFITIKFQKR